MMKCGLCLNIEKCYLRDNLQGINIWIILRLPLEYYIAEVYLYYLLKGGKKMISEVKKVEDLSSRVRKRAAMLSRSIRQVKKLGVDIVPNEPIEGKMFW